MAQDLSVSAEALVGLLLAAAFAPVTTVESIAWVGYLLVGGSVARGAVTSFHTGDDFENAIDLIEVTDTGKKDGVPDTVANLEIRGEGLDKPWLEVNGESKEISESVLFVIERITDVDVPNPLHR